MKCDRCGNEMVFVGRQIQPGHPENWIDGYVCPKKKCLGYAIHESDGTTVRWPALTLADNVVSANIRGAMKFRDGQ